MTLDSLLILSAAVFCIGLYGILSKTNIVSTIMSIELMFNGIIIAAVSFSRFTPSALLMNNSFDVSSFALNTALSGHVFGVFIISIAAAESALALALVFVMFNKKSSVDIVDFNELKG
ncbi:MAG: NADH-quinone oxidoreductase subunit NuoK [Chloroflexi bacterium]|nr:NADH-quinone oxidoreductase subunit NuoK [Chloroflexota bacterium]|tara:strand:+ start:410 stop:763 length:354 start_codon:yes stop_codon:yes gene_type:complete